MISLVILGAGDLAREVFATSLDSHGAREKYKAVAFIDDNPERVGERLYELPICGWDAVERKEFGESRFICAVGSVEGRKAMLQKLQACDAQAEFGSVVHSRAVIMPQVRLGAGCYVAANATLAIAAELEAHVVVNQNVSVGHDCRIGQRSVVSPGCVLSGRSSVGEDCFLGSGAILYPGAKVGAGCTLSAQAVVPRRLKDGRKAIAKPSVMIL